MSTEIELPPGSPSITSLNCAMRFWKEHGPHVVECRIVTSLARMIDEASANRVATRDVYIAELAAYDAWARKENEGPISNAHAHGWRCDPETYQKGVVGSFEMQPPFKILPHGNTRMKFTPCPRQRSGRGPAQRPSAPRPALSARTSIRPLLRSWRTLLASTEGHAALGGPHDYGAGLVGLSLDGFHKPLGAENEDSISRIEPLVSNFSVGLPHHHGNSIFGHADLYLAPRHWRLFGIGRRDFCLWLLHLLGRRTLLNSIISLLQSGLKLGNLLTQFIRLTVGQLSLLLIAIGHVLSVRISNSVLAHVWRHRGRRIAELHRILSAPFSNPRIVGTNNCVGMTLRSLLISFARKRDDLRSLNGIRQGIELHSFGLEFECNGGQLGIVNRRTLGERSNTECTKQWQETFFHCWTGWTCSPATGGRDSRTRLEAPRSAHSGMHQAAPKPALCFDAALNEIRGFLGGRYRADKIKLSVAWRRRRFAQALLGAACVTLNPFRCFAGPEMQIRGNFEYIQHVADVGFGGSLLIIRASPPSLFNSRGALEFPHIEPSLDGHFSESGFGLVSLGDDLADKSNEAGQGTANSTEEKAVEHDDRLRMKDALLAIIGGIAGYLVVNVIFGRILSKYLKF